MRITVYAWYGSSHVDVLHDIVTAFAAEVYNCCDGCYCICYYRYDSHRDQILRSGERHQAGGGPGGFTPGERPEDEVDLFHYFTSSCYSGFRDGPKVGWQGSSLWQQ